MGKVIVLVSTTLDGYADAQNITIDSEFFEFTHGLMANTRIVAFGRNTFETFQERWMQRLRDDSTPAWMMKMAKALRDIPKVVFSSTLKKTSWHNSTIVNKLDVDYIKAFKANNAGALLTFGSLNLVEALTEMNVVDDYYFNVQPLIPGKGETRFFGRMNLKAPLPLKYVECKQQASGAHIIHYKNADAEN